MAGPRAMTLPTLTKTTPAGSVLLPDQRADAAAISTFLAFGGARAAQRPPGAPYNPTPCTS